MGNEIRTILPPKLGSQHFGKKILCYRPMRRTSPRMEVTQFGNKIIASNYGHGGSGWTIGPNSSAYVADLIEKMISKNSKKIPIAILGAGVIGHFSALELLQRGYRNITLIADQFDELTSHNAGALFAPAAMDNSQESLERVNHICAQSYQFYQRILLNKHPFLSMESVRNLPGYFKNREESGLEPLVGNVMQPAKDVILDFRNGKKVKMVAYDDSIYINTNRMLFEMRTRLNTVCVRGYFEDPSLDIQFQILTKKIVTLTELKEEIIINCTGLGAADLDGDQTLIPVQGHLILLQGQNPRDLDYMISANHEEALLNGKFPIKRKFYIFPKQCSGASNGNIGVIGGTFVEGADPTFPHHEEFSLIIERARDFYGLGKSI